MQAIVVGTRSVYEEENDAVMAAVVEMAGKQSKNIQLFSVGFWFNIFF